MSLVESSPSYNMRNQASSLVRLQLPDSRRRNPSVTRAVVRSYVTSRGPGLVQTTCLQLRNHNVQSTVYAAVMRCQQPLI